MAYSLPVFNVAFDRWAAPALPPAPPTSSGLCQLYIASRGLFDVQPNNINFWDPPVILRCPKGTVIFPTDHVAVVGALSSIYKVRWVDAIHLGFTNEYVYAVLQQGV
jgi:hypothetical protein